MYRRLMMFGVKNFSHPMQRATMPFWAGIFYVLVPRARRAIEANLARAIGPASPVEEKARSFRLFVNYAQSITNMYCLHHGQPVPVDAVTIGQEHIFDLQKEGRGAVVVTGHLGFWQIAPILMQRKSYPPLTMAMAQEPNAGTAEWERQFREKFKIVYTTSSPFSTLELASVLRRGELVGMQMDRFAGGPHVMIPFCGVPAPFPLGPATLARATGTPLLPTFIIADADRTNCTFHVEQPIEVPHTRDRDADLREATARAVAVYERYVRQYPEQWFNFFDFWNPPAAQRPPVNPST
ncbi:MAG TPA: lysophospholipid acyltransferase family protein [Polyangia bacterium]|nr:lysophospholipid acyltransferase family protein [Polyangia bacterium]